MPFSPKSVQNYAMNDYFIDKNATSIGIRNDRDQSQPIQKRIINLTYDDKDIASKINIPLEETVN